MKWMEQQSKYENACYAVLWGILFAAPVMSLYVHTMDSEHEAFNWQQVFFVWRQYLMFLVIFLIHNFILAPMLVYRQRKWLYAVSTVVILAVFVVWQCSHRPAFRHPGDEGIPQAERYHDGPRHAGQLEQGAPPEDFRDRPPRFNERRRKNRHQPPVLIGEHDVVATIILVLMLGMNLGVKLYFKTRNDQKKLERLEKENLEQQLEYLKYQINPHFFMNTLNNIHALVDIDPQKAQESIVELSKMMRFILYEGDKQGVPLAREFEFIRNYLRLMRLRFTDKVQISVDLPQEVPDATVPPLMLISFIENAFKHGISYQRPSFVDISVSTENRRLHFICHNSKANKPNQEKGGVGLANVKKRLTLLYDSDYTLNIEDHAESYKVTLDIPLGTTATAG